MLWRRRLPQAECVICEDSEAHRGSRGSRLCPSSAGRAHAGSGPRSVSVRPASRWVVDSPVRDTPAASNKRAAGLVADAPRPGLSGSWGSGLQWGVGGSNCSDSPAAVKAWLLLVPSPLQRLCQPRGCGQLVRDGHAGCQAFSSPGRWIPLRWRPGRAPGSSLMTPAIGFAPRLPLGQEA